MSETWYGIIMVGVTLSFCIPFVIWMEHGINPPRRKKEAPEMSQYGIRLPAPKLGLPSHLESEEAILKWYNGFRYKYQDTSYDGEMKDAMILINRHWRIERSRADDLERMVEQLEM